MRSLALACAMLAAVVVAPSAALAAKPLPPKLRLVLDLRVSAVTTTAVTLRWTDRSVRERRYELSAGGRIVRLAPNARTYRDRPAQGVRRRYRVRACTLVRCAGWSAVVVGRVADPPPAPGSGPTLGGCAMFPADNPWNTPVDALPVHRNSAAYVAAISAEGDRYLHPDFGSNPGYGIPYEIVPATQPQVPIRFVDYGDESDPGPYPVPLDARVEGGANADGDRHVLALQQGTCKLYELFNARRAGAGWDASSGAVFDLSSNRLRPDTWTSADAAGLPILAGLVRRDEVLAGEIRHALRVTVPHTQRAFIHPATHYGATSDPNNPPMGLRLRLRADFDLAPYHGAARIILVAMKRYGLIVADQGSGWYFTGATDTAWDDDDLEQLKHVPGSAFEAVETGPIVRP